jgi:effector-binding domain-containing protein
MYCNFSMLPFALARSFMKVVKMLDTTEILSVAEQRTATIHLTVPRSEIANVMDGAIREVLAVLAAQGMYPVGPCFSYHLQRPGDVFDFEVGFPVAREFTDSGRVKMSKLPACKIARTHYRGGFEGLGAAWGEFMASLARDGQQSQETLWECYLKGPESGNDPTQWCTQLNRPLQA